jgi:hypothetical protein
MDGALTTLRLLLDELGVGSDIRTLDDRKRIQKAVYLGQLSGVDLGYRFGWYRMGPYSPQLTRDYFELASALADEPAPEQRLRAPYRDRLARLRPLLDPPADLPLDREQWLELAASYHYLRHARGLDHDAARDVLAREKPLLAPHADRARAELARHALASAGT